MPIEYMKKGKYNYFILYRLKGEEETLQCPFCLSTHIHGKSDGHRLPHCADIKKDKVIASDGTELFQKDGYIIKTIESHE